MAPPVETASEDAAKAASSTLSQLLARILSQLALSAWLPSAALVLLAAYIFQLGSVLDVHDEAVRAAIANQQGTANLSHLKAISTAFEGLGDTSAGGIALMISAVIVLTMLTQAFTFESIRILEGYWVTWRPVERLAEAFCDYHRWRRQLLEEKRNKLIAKAWVVAKRSIKKERKRSIKKERKRSIKREQEGSIKKGQLCLLKRKHEDATETERILTKEMIRALQVQVLREGKPVSLSPEARELVEKFDWRQHAPAEMLRRLANLDDRLDDYPSDVGTKPTKLGNVLKHYEEETGEESVESIVDEVFDRLPSSLQLTHDEQRQRIDLYCSMTFVFLFIAVMGVLRLGWNEHRLYAVGIISLSAAGSWVAYRAAVASARYYGSLVVTISGYRFQTEDATDTERVEANWWRKMLRLAS